MLKKSNSFHLPPCCRTILPRWNYSAMVTYFPVETFFASFRMTSTPWQLRRDTWMTTTCFWQCLIFPLWNIYFMEMETQINGETLYSDTVMFNFCKLMLSIIKLFNLAIVWNDIDSFKKSFFFVWQFWPLRPLPHFISIS